MDTNNNIRLELEQLSPLIAGIEKINVFSVPDNYFSFLPEAVLEKTQDTEAVFLQGVPKSNVFEVPENYFENLSENILQRIQSETDETISPLLLSLKNSNVFEVPKDYFTTLPDIILSRVQHTPVKIVPMHRQLFLKRFAAAAAILILLSLGTYRFIFNNHSSTKSFASLDPYIQKGIQMNDTNFNKTLNNLSQDEIVGYLEKNGNEEDIATLTSMIDENKLPQQDDYYTNEKILENYLSDNQNIDEKIN